MRLGASVRYRVVAATDDCNATALAERTVSLEEEALPGSLAPAGSSGTHRIADALFTFDPGEYQVCVTPLQEDGTPSVECGEAKTTAVVASGQTTEVLVVSQCNVNQRGALDVVTVLNDPPVIDDIAISPSKFVKTCENVTLEVNVSDPDGDEIIGFDWELLSEGASLVTNGNTATFIAGTAGDYEVLVQVTDVYGGVGSLTVPVHVQGDNQDCAGTIPKACLKGTDPGTTQSPWVVCAADERTAWISADNAGYYHIDLICQNLGYDYASQYGGTWGNVCGYGDGATSCEKPGQRVFDGSGECGEDELGRLICYTVSWECANNVE